MPEKLVFISIVLWVQLKTLMVMISLLKIDAFIGENYRTNYSYIDWKIVNWSKNIPHGTPASGHLYQQ